MSVRKPSHLGSKIHSPAAGIWSTRLASIGRIGGFTGRFMIALSSVPHRTELPRVSWPYNCLQPAVASFTTPATPSRHSRGEGFFASLGPGLITGCADDDPSGI